MHAPTQPLLPDVANATEAPPLATGEQHCEATAATKAEQQQQVVSETHTAAGKKQARKRSATTDLVAVKKVSFSPRARQISIESKNDMNAEDKQKIWWQPPDYEIFGKTTKILSQTALTCPNEKHWLCMDDNTNGKQRKQQQQQPVDVVDIEAENKWWCRFGHSRRGLEHVVSGDEGKHRHLAVRWSRRSVLYEQNRLGKTTSNNYNQNAETLREVSLRCTKWASDLAIASAFSDAHVVAGRAGELIKTRESYLLEMVVQEENKNASDSSPTTTTVLSYSSLHKSGQAHIPEFIKLSLRQQEVLQQAAAAAAVLNWNRGSSTTTETEEAPAVVEESQEQQQQEHHIKRQRISNEVNEEDLSTATSVSSC